MYLCVDVDGPTGSTWEHLPGPTPHHPWGSPTHQSLRRPHKTRSTDKCTHCCQAFLFAQFWISIIVCEMNQTYIHSSMPCENHETSPCVGKAAFWVAEADNLGRDGESLMLHSRPPYMHKCFYLDVEIWGCTQKIMGSMQPLPLLLLTLVSLKNVIAPPFQNVDLFFNLLRPPLHIFCPYLWEPVKY